MITIFGAAAGFAVGYLLGATLAAQRRDDAAAHIWMCGHREGYRRAVQNQYAEGDTLSHWAEYPHHEA